jgi:hypothetical protein
MGTSVVATFPDHLPRRGAESQRPARFYLFLQSHHNCRRSGHRPLRAGADVGGFRITIADDGRALMPTVERGCRDHRERTAIMKAERSLSLRT